LQDNDLTPFSQEQSNALVNLRQAYEQWIIAARERSVLPYGMRFVVRDQREYLYEFQDRSNNGRSLGPRSPSTESQLETYRKARENAQLRSESALARLQQNSKICRALYVPFLVEDAGKILVELDIRGILGTYCMVAGTNAVLAYNLEAGGPLIAGADTATNDFDIVWARDTPTSLVLRQVTSERPPSLLAALKEVDDTYTVNEERPFQLRNRRAYEVEVLVPPSQLGALPPGDRLRPARDLHELEWLLLGTPIEQVTPVRGDQAAKIVAPDPRMFALQKLYIAGKPDRDSLKREKDRRQAAALLAACKAGLLPRHPLDDAFVALIPGDLMRHWENWLAGKAAG
jgi:hypothetical protein